MKFTLTPDLIAHLPGTIVSFALVRNIRVSGPDSTTDKILNEVYPEIKRKYNLETLLQDKNSQAYLGLCKQSNVSPDSAFLPHLQIKRVLKDKKIGNINNIVNHYMTIELLNNISGSRDDSNRRRKSFSAKRGPGYHRYQRHLIFI